MRITDVLVVRAPRLRRPRFRSYNGGGRTSSQGGSAGASNGHRAMMPRADEMVDLMRRRDALSARLAELQWDLGGLAYEMAIRNSIRVDVLVKRAAALQDVDAELNEIERIAQMDGTGTAGACPACGAPHSSGAAYCWQCGQPILEQVSHDAVTGSHDAVTGSSS